jgi:voltage-gated potassium channel
MRRREFIAGLGGVERFQHRLRDLYEGHTPESHRFRYGLLILDLTTLAFIVATLRLLRSYQLLARLRADFNTFRRHEDIIIACANFAVFLFVTTGFVYETQHAHNPGIHNYIDALYFTVAALTTTGFGDITLPGTLGRLISIIIMIFGVTLFFGLARAVLIPNKVRFRCPKCALLRHDPDAVHCKACGEVLNIPNDGLGD